MPKRLMGRRLLGLPGDCVSFVATKGKNPPAGH
jgi:hypothetical protein